MAVHSSRQVTRVWYEVVLPNPCMRGDMLKAMAEAEQRYNLYAGNEAANWDSSYEIVSTEEEIVLRFEERQERSSPVEPLKADLLRSIQLLKSVIDGCVKGDTGFCIKHEREPGLPCPHEEARRFLNTRGIAYG